MLLCFVQVSLAQVEPSNSASTSKTASEIFQELQQKSGYTFFYLEEWMDGLFSADRGSRGSRFTHWLHTHPNAPAIPSGADADAAQWTEGTDMILGIRFTPEGCLPWFDEVDGVRRPLKELDDNSALGRAKTGHLIHELDLICFHRTGLGVNLVITDEHGQPIE